MSIAARRVHHTYPEYLALEEESPIRHEFVDGEIFAMAGGSPDHAALAATVLRLVGAQLPGGCRAFTSDLRVRIVSTGLSTYPDAAVVCGKTRRPPDDPLAVVNPVFLVEITSGSTEEYDRGEKLRHYKEIESVREVLIVSHRGPQFTLHRRGRDGHWLVIEAVRGQAIEIQCVGARLKVDDVYRDELEDVPRT